MAIQQRVLDFSRDLWIVEPFFYFLFSRHITKCPTFKENPHPMIYQYFKERFLEIEGETGGSSTPAATSGSRLLTNQTMVNGTFEKEIS